MDDFISGLVSCVHTQLYAYLSWYNTFITLGFVAHGIMQGEFASCKYMGRTCWWCFVICHFDT